MIDEEVPRAPSGYVLHATTPAARVDIARVGLRPGRLSVLDTTGVCVWPPDDVDDEWVWEALGRFGPVGWVAVPIELGWQAYEDWMWWRPDPVAPHHCLWWTGEEWIPITETV